MSQIIGISSQTIKSHCTGYLQVLSSQLAKDMPHVQIRQFLGPPEIYSPGDYRRSSVTGAQYHRSNSNEYLFTVTGVKKMKWFLSVKRYHFQPQETEAHEWIEMAPIVK